MKNFTKITLVFFLILNSFLNFSQGTCATATTVTSLPFTNSATTCGRGNNYGSSNACANLYTSSGEDYLYSYTPTTTGKVFVTLSGAITSFWHGINITAGCPTTGTCVVSDGTSLSGDMSVSANLTAGTTYYIWVGSYIASGVGGCAAFNINIVNTPSNDDCGGAISLPVNPSTTCVSKVSGSILYATDSGITNSCSTYDDDDVWYKFVATSTIHTVTMSNVVGSATNMEFSVYSGTCGSIGASIGCSGFSSNNLTLSGLTVGATYYVQVYSEFSSNPNTNTFDLCVTSIVPPVNDECVNATTIPVNSNETCTSVASGTINNATNSNVTNSCSTYDDDDVWFKFVATSTYHKVTISNIVGTGTSIRFATYSGSCGSLSSSLGCSNSLTSTVSLSGLTIGATYYVQVYSDFSSSNQNNTFNLCVTTPPPPPINDLCGNAIPLTTSISQAGDNSLATGDNYCAGLNPATGVVGSSNQDNLWYTWTVPADWNAGDPAYVTLTPQNCLGTDGLEFTVYENLDCSQLEVSPSCSYTQHLSFVNNFGINEAIHSITPTLGSTYLINIDGFRSDQCEFTLIVATDPCANAINFNTNGSNCSLQTIVSSNNGPFNIVVKNPTNVTVGSFTNSLGTETITGLPQGDYEVSITNANGCESVVTTSVLCNCTLPEITPLSNQISCTNSYTFPAINGNNITSNAAYYTGTNGTGIRYQAGDIITKTVGSGSYTFYIYDKNILEGGCDDEEILTVNFVTPPTANAGLAQVIDCNNPTVSLNGTLSTGTGSLNFNWSTGNGNIVSGGLTNTASVNAIGTYTLTVTNGTNSCSATSTVNVTNNLTQPTANAGTTQSFGCTTSSLTLDGSASTGVGSLSYNWTTVNGNITSGGTTATPTISSAGTYNLTVTDNSNGCTNTNSVTINSNTTLPTVNAGLDKLIDCNNTSVVLDGSNSTGIGTLSYTWTSSVGGNIVTDELQSIVTVDQPGTYTLTVFDLSSNCSSTDNVVVTLNNTPPVANAGNDTEITCINTLPTLNGNSSSGTGALSYLWTTSNGNFTAPVNTVSTQVNAIGTYTLTVTDASNGCTSNDQVIVSLNNTLPIANSGLDKELTCTVLSVNLDGSNSSGIGSLSYLWSTSNGVITSGSTTNLATVSSNGTYTLTVTDASNGCSATDNVAVSLNNTLPIANAGNDQTLSCSVTSLNLDGTNSTGIGSLTYLWTTINGNIVSGNNSTISTVNGVGTYTLNVTDASNGCSATDYVAVITNSNLPIANAGNTQELNCTNTTLTLDGSNSSSGSSIQYLWTTVGGNINSGSTTNTIIIDQPGTYNLNVLDNSNGCSSNSSVVITQNNIVPVADAGNGGVLNCNNLTLSLDGSLSSQGVDITYNWTTSGGNIVSGSSTNTAIVDQPGDYTITVTNQVNGCSASDLVTITKNISTPVSDAGIDKVITCTSPTVTLNGSNSSSGASIVYLWTTTDGNILSGSTTNSCSVDAIGTYTLRVTNSASGCYSEDVVVVSQNSNIPTANAGGDRVLDCTNTLITLDGSSSSSSSTISYLWTGGTFVSGSLTNKARINTPGTYTLTVTDASNGCSATSSALVTQNITAPIAEAGIGSELSCVLTSVALDGNGSSVGGNYTYNWTGGNIISGANTLTPIVNQANVYTITVTDISNGCTATDNVTITQDASVPVADAGLNEVLNCSVLNTIIGGNTTSTGSTISYLWTTLDGVINSDPTLSTINVNAAGTYLLTVSDNNSGCSSSDNVTVTLDNTIPVVDAGVDGVLNCTQLTFDLDGSASDFGSNISYQWTTINGSFTTSTSSSVVTVNQPGTYTLTVLNSINGCSSNDNVVVIQNNTLPIADAGSDKQLDCTHSSYLLGGNSSTGGSISYAWSTLDGSFDLGATTISPTVSSPGTYTLLVTDLSNGCTASDVVVVTEDLTLPIANAGIDGQLNCTTSTYTIGGASTSTGSQYTYLWNTTTGNITTNNTLSTAVADASGTYSLLVTNTNNGCSSSDAVTITLDNTLPISNAGVDKVLDCSNLSVTLNGSSSSTGVNYTYLWTTSNGLITSGANTNSIITSTAGTYTLTVLNTTNGCSNTDNVLVTNNILYPVANAGNTFELTCSNPTYTLDGSNSDLGMDYSWSTLNGNILNGATSLTPIIDGAGTYTLVVKNLANNCQSTSDVLITKNALSPTADAGIDLIINCNTPTVSLNGGLSSTGLNFTYNWTGGTIVSGATTKTPTVSTPGTYVLVVENISNGCQATDNVIVTGDLVAPSVEAGNSVILDCINTSKTLTGTGSVGSNYTYLWSTVSGGIVSGAQTLTPTVNLPGSYVLTITNSSNGCSNTDNVVVIQNAIVPSAKAGLDDEITCLYTSVNLDGTGSTTGTGIQYSWSGPLNGIVSGGTTLFPKVNIGGNYTLTVTNSVNGCKATDVVTITENNTIPTANAGSNKVINCDNPVVTLDGTQSSQGFEYLYYWSITGGKGNILTDQFSETIDVDLAGTYNLFILNILNFCYSEAEVEVTGDLSTLNLVVSPVTPTCENNLTLDLSSFVNIQGGTYLGAGITSPTSSIMNLNLGAGVHSVDYTVVNPVNNCPITEQVDVEILANPIINFASNVIEGCLPLKVSLTDNNPEIADLCVWNFGDGNSTTSCGAVNHTFESSNCFDVSLTKTFSNGCSTTGTINNYICVNPLPVSDFMVDNDKINSMNTKVQFTNYSQGATNYVWDFGDDLPVSTSDVSAISPEHMFPGVEAIYNVSLVAISDKGCRDTSFVKIKVTEEVIYYIPNSFTPNGNGVNDEFKPVFGSGVSPQDYTLLIFNRWGQIVFESHDINQGWDGAFGVNGEVIQSGSYIWSVSFKVKDIDMVKQVVGEVNLIK